jgi:hypothetical protein
MSALPPKADMFTRCLLCANSRHSHKWIAYASAFEVSHDSHGTRMKLTVRIAEQ